MENTINIVGSRFDRWLVLEVLSRRHSALYYLCLCDCGATKEVNSSSLRQGRSKSCGCLSREVAKRVRLNNLVGKMFGKLSVIERGCNSKNGDAQWLCSCSCGKLCTVRSCNLVSGNTGSCGCARINGEVVRPKLARQKANDRNAIRYRLDSKFNINVKIANAIRISLRRKGAPRKAARWSDLVGYSVDELLVRLKKTLPHGYTWQNFLNGDMEIDHILPLAAFNYSHSGDLDFKRAWALSNLRLIPSLENQQKKDKINGQFQPSLGF